MSLFGKLVSLLGHWRGSSIDLLEILQPGSKNLKEIHGGFLRAFGDKDIVNFYETIPEKIFGIPIMSVSLSSLLKASSSNFFKTVNEESACFYGHKNTQNIPLMKDHRGTNKFASEDDDDYERVKEELERMARSIMSFQASATIDSVSPKINAGHS
jgi:hypothetical protein